MKIHLKKLLAATLLCSAANVVYGEGNSKLSPYTNIFLEMNKQGVIEADGSLKSVMPVVGDVTVKSKALQMQQSRPFTKIVNVNGVQMVESCVVLADGATAADIEAAGAIVVTDIGSVVVAQIPIDAIEQIGALESVKRVEIAQPVRLLNDKAREATHVDAVHAGEGLSSPMTGEGVVVGLVDSGIDFNHVAFKDEEGNTRIVKAYVGEYDPYFGSSGTTYDTPAEIEALTTDTRNESHGTHTSGTAGGSDVGNGLQGMAPDADLYLCGLGDNMMQTDILNQTKAIIDYAKQNNQPAVVNLSLGNNTGAHDGTGTAKAVSDLTGEGAIVVVAAGNEGDLDLYVHKEFENASADEVQCQTIIDGSQYMGESYPGYYYTMIDCYTTQQAQMQLAVVDTRNDNEAVWESELIDINDYNYKSINSLTSGSEFSRYFQVGQSNYIYASRADNGKYETMISLYMVPGSSNFSQRYLLALRFYGAQGDELHMWSNAYSEFTDNGVETFVAGSSEGSYNDLGTGENLISVGAYTTKTKWYPIDENGDRIAGGYYLYYPNATEGTMADFSSYGTDLNGVQHPTIVAPGYGVASAFNRYNLDVQYYGYSYSEGYFVNQIERDGETYIYFINQGTSMACPVVTGIIATWLQCDPTLTPDDIKKIFAATAQKPEAYGTGIAEQWGPNGLIDAYAGLVYLGQSGVNDVTKKQDMVLVGPNPTDGQFQVFAQGEDEVTLSIYSMGGAQVFAKRYVTDNGSIDVDLEGSLSAGIYVLQVRGNKCVIGSLSKTLEGVPLRHTLCFLCLFVQVRCFGTDLSTNDPFRNGKKWRHLQ